MALRKRVIDTGIFKIEETSPGDDIPEFCQEVRQMVREGNDLVGLLKRMREEAVAVRMKHCPGLPLTASHDALPPITWDAAELIYQIDALEGLDILTPDEIDMLGRGFCIGTHHERMSVRPFEPHARRGRNQLAAASKGGKAKAKRGPSDETIARVRAEFEAISQRSPDLSRAELCRRAGAKFGVKPRTVDRRLRIKKV